MEHWSIDDYKNYTNGKKPKKAKYRSYKTFIDQLADDGIEDKEKEKINNNKE